MTTDNIVHIPDYPVADPAIVSANTAKAWEAVCDMETPVSDVERIGTAIYMAAADIEDQQQRAAIHWIATKVEELSAKIEESRGEACHALHNCLPTGTRLTSDNISFIAPEWRRQYDALHDGQTFPIKDDEGFDAAFEVLAGLEDAIANGPIQGAPDALAVLRLWLAFYERGDKDGTPARTIAELEADIEVNPESLEFPDKLVARVLAWLVKICEGRETTKPAMPPEVAEYVAAAAAYDKAWVAYKGGDEHKASHDRAMERLDAAERVIRDMPTATEWDAFAKGLYFTRTILGGSEPRKEHLEKWIREWADALGAPECTEAVKSIGAGQ